MNWLNRLFRPDQPQQQTNEHDLHRAAAALLLEVARTDGTVAQEESQRLIKAVEKHWHLEPQEMDDILSELEDRVDKATDLFEFTRPVTGMNQMGVNDLGP